MNITTDNLIAPSVTPVAGQRVIKIANGIWLPVGFGGDYIPSSASDSSLLSLQAGYINDNGNFQPLSFNGTQASDSGSAVEGLIESIFNTGKPQPQYGGTIPTASMDFYKCTSVSSDSSMTWSGRKAVFNNDIYSFQSDSTEGLTYSYVKPQVDKVYSTDSLVQAVLYTGMPTPANYISFLGSATDQITGDVGSINSASVTDSGAVFNGSNQYISFAVNKVSIAGLYKFSIYLETFIQPDASSIQQAALFAFTTASNGSIKMRIYTSNLYPALMWRDTESGDSGTLKKMFAQSPITTNAWHSYCVVFDAPSARLYVDGVQVAAASTFSGMSSSVYSAFFGSTNNYTYTYGKIRQFKLFKEALTAKQVSILGV